MFKRLRQLRISLAAKCQILFGTAVAAIIFAALFVPWQRMEQLTEQLNERAAAAVAETVLNQHVADPRGRPMWRSAPTTLASESGELAPTTEPATANVTSFPAPRLIGIDALKNPTGLTRFEYGSLSRFSKDVSRRIEHRYYEARDGTEGYRYAEAVYITDRCIACHGGDGVRPDAAKASLSSAANGAVPSTNPTTAPSPVLLGLVSVDFASQIKTKEILLNRVFLLVAGLIAGSLAIVIFYLITTRLILQPVRVLQETAEKVSQGDLNIRSDINTGDEFQQLSETFNVMLMNLKQSADQLRAVNKSLDLKLGQLAESNVALYESNRLKSEFLANVSHELRTPLNSILGFAELLKDQVSGASAGAAGGADGKATRYVQNILGSGNNLLDLINDLLDLAKIEAGRMEVRSEPISLQDLFEALVSLLKPLAEPKQLTIVPSVAPDVPIIQTDASKLQQVLYNFLSNAIKFSPQGARIDLTAELEPESSVRLSVVDRGPGIDPNQHNVIFEKFRQIDGSVTRQHGGTGLGLAISKELAMLLGGSVGLRSTPGEGATFWITIPLAIEASQQDVRSRLVLSS